jgi:hypothetical protein
MALGTLPVRPVLSALRTCWATGHDLVLLAKAGLPTVRAEPSVAKARAARPRAAEAGAALAVWYGNAGTHRTASP